MSTPLPPIDTEQVAQFWDRFRSTGAVASSALVPESVEPFGDSVELADELIELVLHGAKRATAGALVEYELESTALPRPGSLWIATDGAGQARAVLRTTEVRVGPLSSVDEPFAWDEGEGDRTRAWWLAAHERFFRRCLPTIGVAFDPEMATMFERFEVVFVE
ncbi:MAG: ASCH domain-containing protein [Acidimicrobiales bacterium]